MIIEAPVGLADQSVVETLFSSSRLVTGDQQDRAALWVEREGHTPHSVVSIETQLLHVGVTRSVERIHARPTQGRSELFQQPSVRHHLVLDRLCEIVKFRFEGRIEENNPGHQHIMTLNTYVVKNISLVSRQSDSRAYEKAISPITARGELTDRAADPREK